MVRWRRSRWVVTGSALLLGCVVLGGCGTSPRPSPPSRHVQSSAPPSTTATLSPSPVEPTVAQPCGLGGLPPTHLKHVVLIVMENRSYQSIIGSSAAPYVNHLADLCGLATNYQAVAHPSLPNYIALTSGSTQGIVNDSGPAANPVSAPSIFSLLGTGWRSLEESMPSNCSQQTSGEYAVKHNPAAYYPGIIGECRAQDVVLQSPPNISAAFTFITPNLCHDMHDCSTAAGDSWLSSEVPQLLSAPEYRSGQTAIFITWDESDGATQQVPTLVIAPSVPAGARVGVAYNHFSLLRSVEELLNLTPLLGGAASSTSMVPGFHL